MASEPHFVLAPLMSPGHFIPMIDLAKLLAQRGTIVTVVLTPVVADRMKAATDRAIESGLPLRVHRLSFPSAEAGLPEGCESVDTIPSLSFIRNFFLALEMLQKPFEHLLEQLVPTPSCIIADKNLACLAETAEKFNMPRIIFDGMSCFTLLCTHSLHVSKVHESVAETEPFEVPGLPDRIELMKSQLPGAFNPGLLDVQDIRQRIKAGEEQAYGAVINTLEELESRYVEEFRKLKGDRVWCIGPLSLCSKDISDMAERGNNCSIDEQQCLKWLNTQDPGTVIYACLGSLSRLTTPQLIELGLGLEASNHPFIWVIRGGNRGEEIVKWMKENKFEERVKGKGLVIRGWAPQVLILSHPAFGVLLTHCGWNSTIEGICSGVPMIAWPLFAEQFFNEKLIVEVLKTGVSVGASVVVHPWEEERFGVTVRREKIVEAIVKVMDEDREGEERRKRARELGEMAKKAIEEGGSSFLNLSLLIQDLKKHLP